MKGPKVVLIGAGSAFFGRQTIWSMVSKPALCNGTLALVDSDAKKLGWMEKIARRSIAARKVPLKLEVSTDRKDVLKGADFVTLAFANDGVELRGVDARISTKHGMIMCSADTIGPGGTMRTLREVPSQSKILKDVETLCPDAWVINWVNPTAAMGIAMMRHFPRLKSLAICDGPHNPGFDDSLIVRAGLARSAAEVTDALRSRVRIRSGGVNHFNWLVEMTHDGRDVTERIKQQLRAASQAIHVAQSEKGKIELTNMIAAQLADAVGYLPMCIWHTQEYLPYFQGHDVCKTDALTIRQWSVKVRRQWMNECWADMRNIAAGKRPVADFLAKTGSDHASDIIEAMWAGLPKRFYINVANGGAVPNMADDAFLELLCDVNMNDVRPLPFGVMPRPLTGYLQRVLDEHELAVEAAVTHDRRTLRQAFLASMVAVSIPDVDACIAEMLAAEKKDLPAAWYR
ncbi:MAG: glycoside hydrolase family 4 [Lentisphaerae bacterium]|nr:glycoside hydrolase family 4 [Lentisphaerota bacterium]